jgi:NADH-quinone oxidoreductase subunit L
MQPARCGVDMYDLLWLIPALPLFGFFILSTTAGMIGRRGIAVVGVGSVGLSAVLALWIGYNFLFHPPAGHVYSQTLWTWIHVGDFRPTVDFYLDALSMVMIFVVTFVGFLIHLYSSEFMVDDEGYRRYFAYLNLFVFSMLVLVLGGNLLLLFLGWEGVGLCSYLLIGHWYDDPANGLAAQKAFIVTRVGDVAMAIGLFLLFTNLGTLDIQTLMQRAAENWPVGSTLAVAASALLLGGAVGKSAQLPLQTWLPDAMAGPTPVSALIHAATMVTAGVYLVSRTHVLYTLAPHIQLLVAVVGAITLVMAGFSALTQWDIKRVLAYSTISQIGYMFLANGVGAWSAAVFHFMMHAFFKALLFLSAGVVIQALHHEHNIFKMGGLRKLLPSAFWPILIGGGALAAFPIITSGFYSKDLILWYAWSSPGGSPWLWAAGWLGAVLTGMYTFRLIFVAFFGEAQTEVEKRPGTRMLIPLIVLSILSLGAGFLELPFFLGNAPLFTDFLHTALPATHALHGEHKTEIVIEILDSAASFIGIYLAYLLFMKRPQYGTELTHTTPGAALHRFWFADWGFDWLYRTFVLGPYVWWATLNKNDFIDSFYDGVVWGSRMFYQIFSWTQSGYVRWYAAGIAAGTVVFLATAVFL